MNKPKLLILFAVLFILSIGGGFVGAVLKEMAIIWATMGCAIVFAIAAVIVAPSH